MLIGFSRKVKEKSITLSVNGKKLNQVSCVKYLGIIIDNHLTWDDHVNYILKRAFGKITMINRTITLRYLIYYTTHMFYLSLTTVTLCGHQEQ